MTAIFVVMNKNGLAIASDSAASAQMPDENGNPRTVFTEQVSKIYRNEKFQFVVASAGASAVNEIPIEGILNRWFSACEAKDSLTDYVESFIKWLAEESCLEDAASNIPYLVEQMEEQLISLREAFEQDKTNSVIQNINNMYDAWENTDLPNIYGFSEKKVNCPNRDDTIPELFSELSSRFVDYQLEGDLYKFFLSEVGAAFDEAYKNIFESSELLQSSEIELLRQRCINFSIDFNDANANRAQLMFAGYGERDWIPYVITLSLFNFDTLLPRVSIRRVATPESKWYLALASSKAVNKFWDPVDANFAWELRTKLSQRFRGRNYLKVVLEVLDQVVTEHANDVVDPIRSKISLLSVERLGFIARQMVAMESFNSFVFQYLPEVGGNIEVVIVTRDELRELTETD